MRKTIRAVALSLCTLVIGLAVGVLGSVSAQSEPVYELRTYKSTPGNLDNLQARFRNHTIRIFGKHGMEVIGFWVPTDEDGEDTLIYILKHQSREAADASWRAFGQDPEWQRVAEESNRNGQILASVEREYMSATDYSPLK